MKLEFVGKSDTGRKRETNQDAIGVYQKYDAGLFVVADGMGGYANGEKASQTVVAELMNWWKFFSPASFGFEFPKMISAIERIIEYANDSIYTSFNRNEVCGTTVTVLFIYKNLYGIIYAGDSRCYLYQRKRWEQITIDEVWENQSNISYTERIMKNHPNRGKLINAVGIKKSIHCRAVTDMILPDSVFLLCSDGLYKLCADGFMRNCVRKCKNKRGMEQAVNKLMDRVYQNGANDNISIIIVRCS